MHPCEEKKDGCKDFLTLPRMLVDSINEGFRKGELSYTQRKGVSALLYKKDDRADLDNWCPILLLNYNYTICTMAFS